jgi:hypothetical protein
MVNAAPDEVLMKRLKSGLVGWVVALWVLVQALSVSALFDPGDCSDFVYGENTPSQLCLDTMRDFPAPLVGEVPLDLTTMSQYSYWRVGSSSQATPLYDAPHGNVIDQIASGFTFVNAINTSVAGWIQIEGNKWVSTANARFVEPSQFTGAVLLNGLQYDFAWVLGDQMTSPAPGAQQSMEGRFLARYTLINLFAKHTTPEGWDWYMVGENQWVEQRNISIARRIEQPEGTQHRWVAIDLYEQNLVAYEGDTPVFATLVATGLPGTDTREGLYDVWAAIDRDPMSGAVGAPNFYSLQSVPWVLYFDDGISLHGTYWHDLFGFRRSRGCVNLTISDAHYLYDWMYAGEVNDEDIPVASVYVYASRAYRSSGVQTK